MLSGEPGRRSRPAATSSDSADESSARCRSFWVLMTRHSSALMPDELLRRIGDQLGRSRGCRYGPLPSISDGSRISVVRRLSRFDWNPILKSFGGANSKFRHLSMKPEYDVGAAGYEREHCRLHHCPHASKVYRDRRSAASRRKRLAAVSGPLVTRIEVPVNSLRLSTRQHRDEIGQHDS